MSVDDNANAAAAGFRWHAGRVRVTLPACIGRRPDSPPAALAPVNARSDVAALFGVLRQYHQDDQREQSTRPVERGLATPAVRVDSGLMHWVEAALELADDFRENGLLRYERHVASRTPRGRIDWRATVRRDPPCLSNDAAVHLAPVYRAVEAQADHPLTHLHAHTLWDVRRAFGTDVCGEPPPAPESVGRVRPAEAAAVLAREQNQLFRDRDRRVATLLRRYWLDTSTHRVAGRRCDLLWTDQFEFVWQRMVDRVLGGGRAIRPALPKGKYVEDGRKYGGLDLRPDLVVDLDRDTRLIFDAKYYTTGGLPASGDVLKQLAYAYFASRRWDGSLPQRVVSIFLLPADAPGQPVRLSGRHRLVDLVTAAGGGRNDRPLGDDIWLFRVDYRSLADAYVAGTQWPCTQFVEQIGRAEVG